MELRRIRIKNYKSIKDLTLEVKKIGGNYLRTLLGLNESGKSNVLKAILNLNNEESMNYEKDCLKDARRRDKPIEISAIYYLSNRERKNVTRVLKHGNGSGGIKEIEKRITLNSSSGKNIKWIIPNKNNMELPEGGFPYGYESKITYWEASPEYLIKNPINLEEFKNNKEFNVPLRNLFKLIGLSEENMDSSIERMIKGDHAERHSIGKRISKKATEFINEVWPEHEIEFEVNIGDSDCCVFIKDKDNEDEEFFNMDDRSDGFKQFVSILLTLSAKFRDSTNKNNIILIDEPEIHLHPSGVEYLRGELMKIAKENYLIIASHSIFIVDKNNLERHIKVFKEKGETKMEEISETDRLSEEIIYEALGTSIRTYFLIFEGNTDKKLYDEFANKFKQDVSNLTTIPAGGVDKVRKDLKFLKRKTDTGIALFDSDGAGKRVLKDIREDGEEFEKFSFQIYDFIETGKEEITLEDLLPGEMIKKAFSSVYGKELPDLDEKRSFVSQIKEFKSREGLEEDSDLTKFKNRLVGEVLSDLSSKETKIIKEEYPLYVKFFGNLNEKIKDIQRSQDNQSTENHSQ